MSELAEQIERAVSAALEDPPVFEELARPRRTRCGHCGVEVVMIEVDGRAALVDRLELDGPEPGAVVLREDGTARRWKPSSARQRGEALHARHACALARAG